MCGISASNPIETIGSCFLPLFFTEKTVVTKYHILNQETNVPFDGLLGNDFFEKQSALIDFQNRNLVIKSLSVTIPLLRESQIQSNNFLISLKARTETIVELNVLNPDIKEGIIPYVELPKGIYLSHAITKVNKNNKVLATILNTRIIDQSFELKPIRLEPILNNEEILCFKNIDNLKNSINRKEILKNNLRLDH